MFYAIILLFFEYLSAVVGKNLIELAFNFNVSHRVNNPLKLSMVLLIKVNFKNTDLNIPKYL